MTSPRDNNRLPIVVLISGNGSNLQAIIDAVDAGTLHADIRAVISNRPNAHGLKRARRHRITTAIVDHRDYPDREQFDQALQQCIDRFRPNLVVLAGFMRILTPAFVEHYRGRMVNIHPSLLPSYTGLNTHQRAIDAGEREHGVSIHFVTNELDGGPVISQARVPILPGDDASTVADRVLAQEHTLYPRTLEWYCRGRLQQQDDHILFDGRPLDKPIDCTQATET